MLKRLFDLVTSAAVLLLASPLLAVLYVCIKVDSRGPGFYLQERAGRDGKPFKIIKFRTMVVNAEAVRSLTVKGDPRVTRVGKLVRRFELDELPSLINVLKGDMSIVGPRPELPRYVDRYSLTERRVLTVRPGLTDLGTLRFRNETKLMTDPNTFEHVYREQILPAKLRLNLEYLDRKSFLFDLRLIFETLLLVVHQPKG